jgi:hypothetical protein
MRKTFLVVLCALCLGIATPAWANSSPTQGAYGGTGANQISQVHDTTASPSPTATATASAASAGTLPFTGIDVGLVAAVAVVLVGSGLVLRRRVGTNRP